MELEVIEPHLDKIAEDWFNGVDYGHDWGLKIVAAKHSTVPIIDHPGQHWRVTSAPGWYQHRPQTHGFC